MNTTKRLSTKVVARYSDFDGDDMTATGWRWTLYSDGHIAAESRSRWQGTRTDERYITDAGYIDLDTPVDPRVRLVWGVKDVCPHHDPDFRQTNKGYVIQ